MKRSILFAILAILASQVLAIAQNNGALLPARKCDQFPGEDAGAKIIACIADLPSTGGAADLRGLQGSQTISSTISATKPVKFIFGATTYHVSANPGFRLIGSSFSLEGLSETADTVAGTTFIYTNATGTLFALGDTTGVYTSVHIREIRARQTNSTSSTFILCRACEDSDFADFVADGFFNGIRFTGDTNRLRSVRNRVHAALIDGIPDLDGAYGISVDHAADTKLYDVNVVAEPNLLHIKCVIFDRGTDTVYGWNLNTAQGLNGIVHRKTAPMYSTSYEGSPANVICTNCNVDSTGSDGLIFDSSLGADDIRAVYIAINAAGAGIPMGGDASANNIDIQGGSNIQFIGGFSRSAEHHGILISGTGSEFLISGMTITGNDLASSDGDGIHLTASESAHTNIANNYITGNAYGIRGGVGIEYLAISNNDLTGNATGAASVVPDSTTTFINNLGGLSNYLPTSLVIGGGVAINKFLQDRTAAPVFGTVNAQSAVAVNVATSALTGAAVGDAAICNPQADIGSDVLVAHCWVNGSGQVHIVLANPSAANIATKNITWTVTVIH